MTTSRRRFFAQSAVLAAGLSVGQTFCLEAAAAAPIARRKLDEIFAMTPVEMAQQSAVVQDARALLIDAARALRNPDVRRTILDLLENPAPTIVAGNEADIVKNLHQAGLLDADRTTVFPENGSAKTAAQPFWSAPGSGYGSHHAYPGGLATHCALNVVSAVSLHRNYRSVNNLTIDYDAAIGGELLHDLHKPWVFQWQPDHSCRKEERLAATGEHHVLSLAESIARKLPAELIVAQACAHEHPASPQGEALVVGWLKAAAIIAGVDPIASGLLASDGKTLPLPRRIEGWVVHLADHDWVISVSACKLAVAAVLALGREKYGIKEAAHLNAWRNYVLANLTAMRLYGILSSEGKVAFEAEVARLVAI